MKKGIDLKIHRIKLGIKLQEIANVLNCSNAFITYMEKGERKIPQDKYNKWIEFLECKNN